VIDYLPQNRSGASDLPSMRERKSGPPATRRAATPVDAQASWTVAESRFRHGREPGGVRSDGSIRALGRAPTGRCGGRARPPELGAFFSWVSRRTASGGGDCPSGITGINFNGPQNKSTQGGILQSRVTPHGAADIGIRCRRKCEMSFAPFRLVNRNIPVRNIHADDTTNDTGDFTVLHRQQRRSNHRILPRQTWL
jgi:hypothetical protein